MTTPISQLNSYEIQNHVKLALNSEPTGSQGLDSHSAIVKQAIKQMLDRVGFEPHSVPFSVDKELELLIREDLNKLNLDAKSLKQAEQRLVLAVSWTHLAWKSLSLDVKVAVAKQLLYMFLIDDFAEDFMDDLIRFGQRVSAIVKNSLEYVAGRVVEHQMLASQFQFSPVTKMVPVFLRPRVGGSEIMAHMVFDYAQFPEEQYLLQCLPAIPAMMQFADYSNDILSYYKEFVIADEKYNFVDNFAESHGLSHIQVLCNLAEHAAEVHAFGRQVMSHDPKLLEVYDQWIRGLIQFFTAHRRYHLVELFASDGYLPPYHGDS
ncbi:Trichodiene synthase [Penicillium griseofulvum]|uniref:Trichodiene synthase n=1 Tax=Penicillium patulum TaxID=5078 RepID=A0A135LJU9_PENPA|nr:Trichodiene synthase [Penicillium griseofulvum]KXG49219.1 Trichodiene synthase [Penicillium griseofulvum]